MRTLTKFSIFLVTLLMATSVYSADDWTFRWPSYTQMQVITPTTGDSTYLKLDCSNDPLTGSLDLDTYDLTLTGTISNLADNSKHVWGAAGVVDSYIQFGGDNLEYYSSGGFEFKDASGRGNANIGIGVAPNLNYGLYISKTAEAAYPVVTGLYVAADGSYRSDNWGIVGQCKGSFRTGGISYNSVDIYGVYGKAYQDLFSGALSGALYGVYGIATPKATYNFAFGVYGTTTGSSGSGVDFAGYFDGDVHIAGQLTGGDISAFGDTTAELDVRRTTSLLDNSNVTGDGTMVVEGEFSNATNLDYEIYFTVEGNLGTAEFKWSDDGGGTWDEEDLVTLVDGVPYTLNNGLRIYFVEGAGTDFNVDDYVTFTAIGTDNQLNTLLVDTTNNDVTIADTIFVSAGSISTTTGDLKIMPDVQGGVALFGDTDVANGVDGKSLHIYRKAEEGDNSLQFVILESRRGALNANCGWDLLASGGTQTIRFLGSEILINDTGAATNAPIKIYGEVGGAKKYAQFLVDETDDYFTLTREDSNILGFKIDMPVTMTGTLGAGAITGTGTGTFGTGTSTGTVRVGTSDAEYWADIVSKVDTDNPFYINVNNKGHIIGVDVKIPDYSAVVYQAGYYGLAYITHETLRMAVYGSGHPNDGDVQIFNNLGIGTSLPKSDLHLEVTGTATPTSLAEVSNGAILLYNSGTWSSTSATSGIFGYGYQSGADLGMGSGIGFSRESADTWGTQIRFYTRPAGFTTIGNIYEHMRIMSDGKVGIGTISPNHKLVIDNTGVGTVLGLYNSYDHNNNRNWAIYQSGYAYGDLAFKISDAQNGNPVTAGSIPVIFKADGSVGINESAPQDKLEVNGTIMVKDKLKFTQDDGNEYIDSLNDGYMDYGATTGHRFNTPVRSSTASYRRYYHIPSQKVNPGASGAAWVDPSANIIGGWRVTADAQTLIFNADVHSDWDGTDITVDVYFAVGAAGNANDTIDLLLTSYYNAVGDTATKTQNSTVATVTDGTLHKVYKATFTIDADAVDNVVEAGDGWTAVLNLVAAASEIDNAVIEHANFYYSTTHVGLEAGDI